MSVLLWQLLGLALLFGTIAIGYRLVRRRTGRALSLVEAGAVLTLLATLGGGFWGAFAWWPDNPGSFAWNLPALVSRMLAAAGWAFALVCYFALRRPTPRNIRLAMVLLAVYLGPLALAILTLHLGRFDPVAPITYAFFVIVAVLLTSALRYSVAPVGLKPNAASRTPPVIVRAALLAIAAVALSWGAVLFALPSGPVGLVAVWPTDPLASRLIAAMLLTVGAGAWLSRSDTGTARIALAMTLLYGLGVLAAGFVSPASGYPPPPPYGFLWGGLGLLAALALIAGPGLSGVILAKPPSGETHSGGRQTDPGPRRDIQG